MEWEDNRNKGYGAEVLGYREYIASGGDMGRGITCYINIELSNTCVILLAIVSAIFMVVGIFIKDKSKDK